MAGASSTARNPQLAHCPPLWKPWPAIWKCIAPHRRLLPICDRRACIRLQGFLDGRSQFTIFRLDLAGPVGKKAAIAADQVFVEIPAWGGTALALQGLIQRIGCFALHV